MAIGCVVLFTAHALVKVDGAEACVDSSRTGVVKGSIEDVSATVDVNSTSIKRIEDAREKPYFNEYLCIRFCLI